MIMGIIYPDKVGHRVAIIIIKMTLALYLDKFFLIIFHQVKTEF